MVRIGSRNLLKVVKRVEFGLYLDGGEDGEILLPRRYVPGDGKPGDTLDVFIYNDSDDRLIATTETPRVQIGEFARLKVIGVEGVGAFLDWGLSKDLLLPYSEQTRHLRVGEEVLVHVYIDKSRRVCASMKLERHSEGAEGVYEEGQSVGLWIASKTDLGFTAVIEGRHLGLLYDNEIFTRLDVGQRVSGYIKKLRKDGKIDLTLQRTGHKGADEIGEKILTKLREKNGYLAVNDMTPPEAVYGLFGVSKKKFKAALGGLYRKRMITLEADGIRLATGSGSDS